MLLFGRDTLLTAADLERTVARRVSVPLPLVELHQTTDDELTDTEIDDLPPLPPAGGGMKSEVMLLLGVGVGAALMFAIGR